MVETVLPGVGVFYPGSSCLEGDASRLRGLTFKESFKHLVIHVHQPEHLGDVLSQASMAAVEHLTVDYRVRFSMNNLTRAILDSALSHNLRRLDIDAPLRTIEPLQRLCYPLALASIHVPTGVVEPLGVSSHDQVVVDEDSWFRHRDDSIATFASQLLWCESEVVARRPRRLYLDCEGQFHTPSLLTTGAASGIEEVTLFNIDVTSEVILTFLRSLKLAKLRRFRLTTYSGVLSYGWVDQVFQAFARWPHLRGSTVTINQLSKL